MPKKVQMTPRLKKAIMSCVDYLQKAGGKALKQYRPNEALYIYSDASKLFGLGFVCVQKIQNDAGVRVVHLIQCRSRSLSSAEKNY